MSDRPPTRTVEVVAAERLRAQAHVASAVRLGDKPAERRYRAEAAALQIEVHVRRIVAAAPPLTDAQRSRLAALLLDGS